MPLDFPYIFLNIPHRLNLTERNISLLKASLFNNLSSHTQTDGDVSKDRREDKAITVEGTNPAIDDLK